MGTKLERISQLSKENPEMVFTSIGAGREPGQTGGTAKEKVVQTTAGKEGGNTEGQGQNQAVKHLLLRGQAGAGSAEEAAGGRVRATFLR